MNKLLLSLLILISNLMFAQDDIPKTNLKILDYLDSLRINHIYDIPNTIEKAMVYADAKLPDGQSYGIEYSDLHELLPGDIYFITNYFEHQQIPPDSKQEQRRDENNLHKVEVITIQQYKFVQAMLNGSERKEEREILELFFGIKDFDSDKLHFYHPIPMY